MTLPGEIAGTGVFPARRDRGAIPCCGVLCGSPWDLPYPRETYRT